MKKRLAIFLLGLGSLAAVSVSAYNNVPQAQECDPVAQCVPAPCDSVPCNPCDTTCNPVPCNNPAPCNPAPCNPGC